MTRKFTIELNQDWTASVTSDINVRYESYERGIEVLLGLINTVLPKKSAPASLPPAAVPVIKATVVPCSSSEPPVSQEKPAVTGNRFHNKWKIPFHSMNEPVKYENARKICKRFGKPYDEAIKLAEAEPETKTRAKGPMRPGNHKGNKYGIPPELYRTDKPLYSRLFSRCQDKNILYPAAIEMEGKVKPQSRNSKPSAKALLQSNDVKAPKQPEAKKERLPYKMKNKPSKVLLEVPTEVVQYPVEPTSAAEEPLDPPQDEPETYQVQGLDQDLTDAMPEERPPTNKEAGRENPAHKESQSRPASKAREKINAAAAAVAASQQNCNKITMDQVPVSDIVTGVHVRQTKPDAGRQIYGTGTVVARHGEMVSVRNGNGKTYKILAACLEVVTSPPGEKKAAGEAE